MQPTNRPAFVLLITESQAFYRQDVSDFAMAVWWQACLRYDLEQVQKALTAHAMDPERGQFAPKPADLVRQLDGTTTDRAALAWSKLHDAAQTVGAYTDVVFDDPAIHAVVLDLGGWSSVCRTQTSELSYLRHRFTESYRAYAGRPTFDYPRQLLGDRSSDEAFIRRGLPAPKPVLIGDQHRARTVMEQGLHSRPSTMALLDAVQRTVAGIQDSRPGRAA
jgi:hypothetical protein